jgi:hypothetical protein
MSHARDTDTTIASSVEDTHDSSPSTEPASVKLMRFKPNLTVLDQFIKTTLPSFPLEHSGKQYSGPSLLISGSLSNYVEPSMYPSILKMFPQMRFERLECGHWVHAEKTKDFVHVSNQFYASL